MFSERAAALEASALEALGLKWEGLGAGSLGCRVRLRISLTRRVRSLVRIRPQGPATAHALCPAHDAVKEEHSLSASIPVMTKTTLNCARVVVTAVHVHA